MDYSLGPRVETDEHYALLRHTLTLNPQGTAVEFGVGKGESTRIIAEHMPVIGFDTFRGLPTDWRDGFPAGMFAQTHAPAIDNAEFVIGLFEDTLPDCDFSGLDIGLLHVDVDLYASTETVLRYVGPHLASGAVVVFDEWHSYPQCEEFEQRAWREYVARTGISWTVIGHGHEAWAIRISGDNGA
jgi:predicted O-methyltransferase YrrM